MNATPSHRQPPPGVQADVASGGVASLAPRWRPSDRGNLTSNRDTPVAMEPAGGRPTSPAGLLFLAAAFFATLALICLSGPVPGADGIEPGRVAMGWVYLCVALVFFLARISAPLWQRLQSSIIAWAEHRQWSKRELRRLVAQLEGAG